MICGDRGWFSVTGIPTIDKAEDGSIINEYSFEYDADGNIITENSAFEPDVNSITIPSETMVYGDANRLISYNGTSISYDADGNMLSTSLGDKWGALTYNSENMLMEVTVSGSAIAVYTYDAEGNRIAKTEKGVTTTYVVDTNSTLSQVLMSTANGETTYYVYGLGLISQENSDGYKLYHYDYRGSTTTITNLNGEVIDTLYYDPYGNIISRTGTTDTPFLYVGQYGVETDDSGLYYMRARYYNPQIQRFINVDPIRDGYNWYLYTDDSPIINIDPSGEVAFIIPAVAVAIGAVAGTAAYQVYSNINRSYRRTVRNYYTPSVSNQYVSENNIDRRIPGYRQLQETLRSTILSTPQDRANALFESVLGYPAEVFVQKTIIGIAPTILGSRIGSNGIIYMNENKNVDKKPTSQSQMQKQVERGQAPKEVDRVDKPHIEGQQPHVHFKDGTSQNIDGSVHDAHRGTPNLTNKVKKWLTNNGWKVND